VKTALARVKEPAPYGVHQPIELVFPEDRTAVQTNLFLVLQAYNHNKIDARACGLMTYNLQVCLNNLGKTPLVQPDLENTVQRVILTPEGEEIAPPREALEEGENPPLHHKGCPCRRCAEEFRNAAPEQHHPNCTCGLCEPAVSQPAQSDVILSEATSGSAVEEPAVSQPAQTDVILSEATNGSAVEESAVSQPAQTDTASASLNLTPYPLSPEPRSAPAQKLYNPHLTLDPVNKEVSLYDYLYGGHHKKHEAQYAARARAAIEAGLEPPPYEPFDPNKIESKSARMEREDRARIEANREAARLAWNKRYPDKQEEPTPYLTWGEQHDLKLAKLKQLQEEDEARLRSQAE
jgi:hypothetical protein